MKPNFTCPRCENMIKVSKQLRCNYICPYCFYSMVIKEEDLKRGTQLFIDKYQEPSSKARSNHIKQKRRM